MDSISVKNIVLRAWLGGCDKCCTIGTKLTDRQISDTATVNG